MEREARLSTSSALAIGLGLAVLAAIPLLASALGNPAMVTLATRIVIYAIAAASLNLVLGYGGMVSFGHAAFFGIGGYTVGILFHHHRFNEVLFGLLPGSDQFLVTVPAAILVSGLAALVIGALALRTTGVQFIMITLAFAQMLFFLFVALKRYGGDDGLIIRRPNALLGLNLRDSTTMYMIALTAMVLFLVLLWRITGSRFGMVLGGIRQNERRMAAIGIASYRYKLAAFVISGMGAGLAGALWANYARFVSPDMLHWTKSGELMVMVILGGTGTLLGPLFGAAALISLETVLAAWTEHWQVILGPVLIVIILFFRGGLAGLVDLVRGRR
jgi:branched-chain amino acid transport system permease protein